MIPVIDRERRVLATRKLKETLPASDRRLWHWVESVLGMEIAWRPTCEEHTAPFQFLADAVFGRFQAAALHGPRGGGKTKMMSILHLINGHYKPRFEVAHVGAIMRQSNLCYRYLRDYFKGPTFGRALTQEPLMEHTYWRNGSHLQILPGCLPEWGQVITADGPMPIGRLVANKLSGPVLSYDFEAGEWVWRRVTGWFKNGQTDEW